MRRRVTLFRPGLLAAALSVLIVPARPAQAQTTPPDKKDQEIELLKAEVEQLEQRVDHLEPERKR
jgi:hypothetical protein